MSEQTVKELVVDMAIKAKKASRTLGSLPTAVKNQILLRTAEMLLSKRSFIQDENEKDLAGGKEKGLSAAIITVAVGINPRPLPGLLMRI